MRKEPFFVGDMIHVFNRGNRKQCIVKDDIDRWRFLQMLYYFNSEYATSNPMQTLQKILKSDFNTKLVWPKEWPIRNPLVKIHALILMDNHYHLIMEEIREGGVAKFMQKIGTGITNRFNCRYKETGRLFQGAYKARRIDRDNYLRYILVYLHIKNIFELYSGGFKEAVMNFDDAYEFASQYSYSSLGAYLLDDHITEPIITKDMCQNIIGNKNEFRDFAKGCIDFVYFDEKKNEISITD